MSKYYFEECQVGEGDIAVVNRIMIRLGLAKAASMLGLPNVASMPLDIEKMGNYEIVNYELLEGLQELLEFSSYISCEISEASISDYAIQIAEEEQYYIDEYLLEKALILRISEDIASQYATEITRILKGHYISDICNDWNAITHWLDNTTLVVWFCNFPNNSIIGFIEPFVELALKWTRTKKEEN